jgi:hypothetical protein
VITFIYIGKKHNTLLFFLILAKRVIFYLFFGSLYLENQPGEDGLFMQHHFSSVLGYHFIIWYIESIVKIMFLKQIARVVKNFMEELDGTTG